MPSIVSSFAILLAFITASIATVPIVEADIANITSQVDAFTTTLNSVPNTGASLEQVTTLEEQVANLVVALNNAAIDIEATPPVDEADGQTILASATTLQQSVISLLDEAAAKKSAVENTLVLLDPVGVVHADLQTVQGATKTFENALIADCPDDLLSQAASLTSAVDAAFVTAIAIYATT